MRGERELAGTVAEERSFGAFGLLVRLEGGEFLHLPWETVGRAGGEAVGKRFTGFARGEEGFWTATRGILYVPGPWFRPHGRSFPSRGASGLPALLELGVPEDLARNLHGAFGPLAWEAFATDPYLLARILPFSEADRALLALGFPPHHPRRLSAFAEALVEEGVQRTGGTALPLEALEDLAEASPLAPLLPLALSQAVEEERLYLSGDLVALRHHARWEEEIAKKLLVPKTPPACLRPLQEEAPRAVVEALGRGRPVLLLGEAGSGKTTALKGVLEACAEATLLAPTGKAAKRLAEATGRRASTVHAFLARGGGGEGVVVVDEFSMVSTELLWSLLRAVGLTTPLLFVGDPKQLPPVDPGSPIRELAQFLPKVVLEGSRRLSQGLGERVKGLLEGRRESLTPPLRLAPLSRGALAEALSWADGREGVLLTPLRRGRWGAEGLNEAKLRALGAKDPFFPGAPVVALEAVPSLGVANGEAFTVRSREREGFLTEEGLLVPWREAGSFGAGFALTVHRAQGSEWPKVAVLLPRRAWPLLTRNWLYTALTRAREEVLTLAEGGEGFLLEVAGREGPEPWGLTARFALEFLGEKGERVIL